MTDYQRQLVNTLSIDLGINPQWLIDLVSFESRWNPTAKNPLSSARGLLQFTNDTARNLGYADSLDLVTQNPTIEAQLIGPVREYLTLYGPYSSAKQLYMAVFFPAAKTWPEDMQFPENVQAANPGIKTVGDYVHMVEGYSDQKKINVVLIAGAIGAAVVFYILSTGG